MLVRTFSSPAAAMRAATEPCGWRTRRERIFVSSKYDHPAISDFHRLGGQRLDPREVLVQRFQFGKYRQQRRAGDWLDHESRTLFSQDCLTTTPPPARAEWEGLV